MFITWSSNIRIPSFWSKVVSSIWGPLWFWWMFPTWAGELRSKHDVLWKGRTGNSTSYSSNLKSWTIWNTQLKEGDCGDREIFWTWTQSSQSQPAANTVVRHLREWVTSWPWIQSLSLYNDTPQWDPFHPLRGWGPRPYSSLKFNFSFAYISQQIHAWASPPPWVFAQTMNHSHMVTGYPQASWFMIAASFYIPRVAQSQVISILLTWFLIEWIQRGGEMEWNQKNRRRGKCNQDILFEKIIYFQKTKKHFLKTDVIL